MQQWQEALEQAGKAIRCGAKTRQSTACMSPAMPNGKCRMHGGASTGAPCGKKHGRYKHGRFTKESKAFYAELNRVMRESFKYIEQI